MLLPSGTSSAGITGTGVISMTLASAPCEVGILSTTPSHPHQKPDSTWQLVSLPNPRWDYVIGGVEVTCMCFSYKGIWKCECK